jgi:hypothetical protein
MNNNVTNRSSISIEVIQGIFDSDGSFQVRFRKNNNNFFNYYISIVFCQSERNQNILYDILSFFNDQSKAVTAREQVISTSSKEYTSKSITLGITSNGRREMFAFWSTNPPIAQSKLNDWRIVNILNQVNSKNSNYLVLVNSCLEQKDHITSPRLANLALLGLRFRMHGSRYRQTELSNHYKTVKATDKEIAISQEICNKIMIPITNEQQQIQSNPSLLIDRLSDDYLLGYYIGDGCFMLQVSFVKNSKYVDNTVIHIHPQFTLTDCLESLPLLQAIKQKLNCGYICTYPTYLKYIVSSIEGNNIITNLWKTKSFPQPRRNQYDLMCEALLILEKKEHLIIREKLQRIIEIKWSMNEYTNFKKEGSLEIDTQKADDYFNNK